MSKQEAKEEQQEEIPQAELTKLKLQLQHTLTHPTHTHTHKEKYFVWRIAGEFAANFVRTSRQNCL